MPVSIGRGGAGMDGREGGKVRLGCPTAASGELAPASGKLLNIAGGASPGHETKGSGSEIEALGRGMAGSCMSKGV